MIGLGRLKMKPRAGWNFVEILQCSMCKIVVIYCNSYKVGRKFIKTSNIKSKVNSFILLE